MLKGAQRCSKEVCVCVCVCVCGKLLERKRLGACLA